MAVRSQSNRLRLPSLPGGGKVMTPTDGFVSLIGWLTAFVSQSIIALVEDGALPGGPGSPAGSWSRSPPWANTPRQTSRETLRGPSGLTFQSYGIRRLRQGEILVEAQDVPVDNVSELDAILIRYRAGAEVHLTGPLRAR